MTDSQNDKVFGVSGDNSYDLLSQFPLPQYIFNRAAFNMTPSELSVLLSFGSRPLTILSMPLATAKSFANMIMDQVNTFEAMTGTQVLSIEEIEASIRAKKQEQ